MLIRTIVGRGGISGERVPKRGGGGSRPLSVCFVVLNVSRLFALIPHGRRPYNYFLSTQAGDIGLNLFTAQLNHHMGDFR